MQSASCSGDSGCSSSAPSTAPRCAPADPHRPSQAGLEAAGRGFVDAVIEPAETRRKLARSLLRTETKDVGRPERKHGNIPT